MKRITLYTWPHCPFCAKAKRLLDDKGYTYNDVNIYGDNDKKKKLTELTGQTTVPYIFLDHTLLGGCAELENAMDTGRFDEMVE
ncbi:MAG: glutaredoxin family protein [Eubacteriaceae bacterium]|jgi:glutaredoxin 3